MSFRVRALLLALVLVVAGAAVAQESRGWLGADLQDVTKAEAHRLGWDAPRGAKLGPVAAGSPADKAGLKAGDIVLAIDRTLIDASSELESAIAAKRPGEEVRLQVLSGGRERRVAITVAGSPRTQAADAAALPILMLDSGGHTALIRSIAFTPDGKHLLSSGEDKVIRVWDWQAGKTVRAIRGQVGAGHEGKNFAMALSPDGRWLAVAGWMDFTAARVPCCGAIRLYDFATGKLAALLKGHESVVNSLAFSPDSRRLVSGSGLGDRSVIVWDVQKRALLHRMHGHTAEIYAVAFTPDGARVVSGGYNSKVKLWSVAEGRELATMVGHREKVRALAVSPVDSTIASGDLDGEIRLWDGRTGRYLRTLANQGIDVGALSFSPDGRRLVSAITKRLHDMRRYGARVWEVDTGTLLASYDAHSSISLAIAIKPDASVVATAGGSNQQIYFWNPDTAETRRILEGSGSPVWAAGFSADGTRIGWGTVWRDRADRQAHTSEATSPIRHELGLPAGSRLLGQPERVGESNSGSFLRARTTHGAFSIMHRRGGSYGYEAILDIKKDGQVVASMERGSSDGYDHRAYTFTPDGRTIITGGIGGVLSAFDLTGKKIGDFVGNDGDIWSLAPSPDGRLLISGSHDQTVRLWNINTRELIVTLFHGSDGEWVMWTPQGYYTGSPGADKIVGWQINKGPDKEADYVGADQLRNHLYRPDIVEKAIVIASAEQAVREAPGTSFKLADLLARPVPRFRIVSPASGSTERVGRTSVRIAIEATPDPVRLIRVQVNGRQVGEENPDIGSGGFGAGERSFFVPLANGRNEVRVALTNAIGEKVESLIINHDGEGELDRRGVLQILAIGVNDYKGLPPTCGKNGNESCDLKFPRNDATKFADAIERRLGPAHSEVIKRVLINGADPKDAPTAANITDAVELLRHARENDTVVLFIAGHGSNEGPDYRFLPTNVEWAGGMLRGSTVVPWQVLQGAVEAAKGRRILFVDTCHSGGAYNQRLGNAAYHANIVAYTAARFDQEALEDPGLGHGLFTYAVVEGLEGKGGAASRRQLSTTELADYIKVRVGALAQSVAGQNQEPQYYKGRDAVDFVLARW